MDNHRKPVQARSQKTYDALLDAAGHLLGEVGIERISTNMICERAGTTPPAFYRYFDDKYAIIATLAERLMLRQNVALKAWVIRYADAELDLLAEKTIELLRTMHAITSSEPGALWIMRSLHAVPSLTHLRLQSHNLVADILTDLYARHLPHVDRALLRRRTRLSVELAYSIDEMLKEEDVDPEAVFQDAHFIFTAMFDYPEYRAP
ncbi:MAG: TetR/AcrR family transcriptional regulator [Lysobacteraceae bacterium]|nr:MAG: TetR/AcrR family transcriptional regulator [Xanthomonadaceae bacterium]